MLCKLIGSICLLGAGGYAALTLHRYEQRRMAVLDGYMALLYYIKGEIDCYARPITDILASADPAIIAACLGLPTKGVQACDPPPVSLSSMVAASRAYLPPEPERLLTAFSGEVGHTHRLEQVARCDHYLTALGEERRRLSDSLSSRTRMATVLSLSGAAGMILLLW